METAVVTQSPVSMSQTPQVPQTQTRKLFSFLEWPVSERHSQKSLLWPDFQMNCPALSSSQCLSAGLPAPCEPCSVIRVSLSPRSSSPGTWDCAAGRRHRPTGPCNQLGKGMGSREKRGQRVKVHCLTTLLCCAFPIPHVYRHMTCVHGRAQACAHTHTQHL